MNTLLENAIQEAMAELDKTTDKNQDGPSEDILGEPITETPKRSKKEKRKDKHHKKSSALSNKGEARLRSAR